MKYLPFYYILHIVFSLQCNRIQRFERRISPGILFPRVGSVSIPCTFAVCGYRSTLVCFYSYTSTHFYFRITSENQAEYDVSSNYEDEDYDDDDEWSDDSEWSDDDDQTNMVSIFYLSGYD